MGYVFVFIVGLIIGGFTGIIAIALISAGKEDEE